MTVDTIEWLLRILIEMWFTWAFRLICRRVYIAKWKQSLKICCSITVHVFFFIYNYDVGIILSFVIKVSQFLFIELKILSFELIDRSDCGVLTCVSIIRVHFVQAVIEMSVSLFVVVLIKTSSQYKWYIHPNFNKLDCIICLFMAAQWNYIRPNSNTDTNRNNNTRIHSFLDVHENVNWKKSVQFEYIAKRTI